MEPSDQFASLQQLLDHVEKHRKWGVVAAPPKIGMTKAILTILENKKRLKDVVVAKVSDEPQSKEEQSAHNLWNVNLHKYSNQQEYISMQIAQSSLPSPKAAYHYLDLSGISTISDFWFLWTSKLNEKAHSNVPVSIHYFQEMLRERFLSHDSGTRSNQGLILFDHVCESVLPWIYDIFVEISEHLGIVVIPEMSLPYIPPDRSTLSAKSTGPMFSLSHNPSLVPTESLPYSMSFVRQLGRLCESLALLDHLNQDTLFPSAAPSDTSSSPSHTFKYHRVLIIAQGLAGRASESEKAPALASAEAFWASQLSHSQSPSTHRNGLSPSIHSSQDYEQYTSLLEVLSFFPAMKEQAAFALRHFRASELLAKIKTLHSSASRFAKEKFTRSVEHQIEWHYRLYYMWFAEAFQRVFDEQLLATRNDSIVDEAMLEETKNRVQESIRKFHSVLSQWDREEAPLVLHCDCEAAKEVPFLWELLSGSGFLVPLESEKVAKEAVLDGWYRVPASLLPFLRYHLPKTVESWANPNHLHQESEDVAKIADGLLTHCLGGVLRCVLVATTDSFTVPFKSLQSQHVQLEYLVQSQLSGSEIASSQLQTPVALVLLAVARDYLLLALPMETQLSLLSKILPFVQSTDVIESLQSVLPASNDAIKASVCCVVSATQYLLHVGHMLAFTTTSTSLHSHYQLLELLLQTTRHLLHYWEKHLLSPALSSTYPVLQYLYDSCNFQFQVLITLTSVRNADSECMGRWIERITRLLSEAMTKYEAVDDEVAVKITDTTLSYLVTMHTHCMLLYVKSQETDCGIFAPLLYLHAIRLSTLYPGLHTLTADFTREPQSVGSVTSSMYEYLYSVVSPHVVPLHNLISFHGFKKAALSAESGDRKIREGLSVEETTYILQLFVECESLLFPQSPHTPYLMCLKGCLMLLLHDFASLPLPLLNETDGTWDISHDNEESLVYWQQHLIAQKQDLNSAIVETGDAVTTQAMHWECYRAFGFYHLAEIQSHLTPHLLLSTITSMQRSCKLHSERGHKQFNVVSMAVDESPFISSIIPQSLQWFGNQFFAIHVLHYHLGFFTMSHAFNAPSIQMHEELMCLVFKLVEDTKLEVRKLRALLVDETLADWNVNTRTDMVDYFFTMLSLLQAYLLLAHDQGMYTISTSGYRFLLQQLSALSPLISSEDNENFDEDLRDGWATWYGEIEQGISLEFAHTLVRLALSLAQLPIPESHFSDIAGKDCAPAVFVEHSNKGKTHRVRTTQLFSKVFRDTQSSAFAYGSKNRNNKTIAGLLWRSEVPAVVSSVANSAYIHEYDYYQAIQCLLHAGSLYEYQLQQSMKVTGETSGTLSPQERVNLCGSFLITVYFILATIHTYQHQLVFAQDCYENMLKLFLKIPKLLDLSVLAQIQQQYGIWCIQNEGAKEIVGSSTAHGMVLMKYSFDYYSQSAEALVPTADIAKPAKIPDLKWQAERIHNLLYQIMGCLHMHDFEDAQEKVNSAKTLLFELYPKHTISVTVDLSNLEENPAQQESKEKEPENSTSDSAKLDVLPVHVGDSAPTPPPSSSSTIITTSVEVVYHYDYAVLSFFQGLLHAHYEEFLDSLIQFEVVANIHTLLGFPPSSLECLQLFWQQSIIYHRMGLSQRAQVGLEEVVSILLAIHGSCYPQILQVLTSLKDLYSDLYNFANVDSIGEFMAEVESRYYDKLAVQLAPYKQQELQYLDSILPDMSSSHHFKRAIHGGSKSNDLSLDTISASLSKHEIIDNEKDDSDDETETPPPKAKKTVKKKSRIGEDPGSAGYYFAFATKQEKIPQAPKNQSSGNPRTKFLKHQSSGSSTTSNSAIHHLTFDFEALSHNHNPAGEPLSASSKETQNPTATNSATNDEGVLPTRWKQLLKMLPLSSSTNTLPTNLHDSKESQSIDRFQTLQALHRNSSSTSNALVDEEVGKAPQKVSGVRNVEKVDEEADELPSGNGCIVM